MNTLTVKARAGHDGILKFEIPTTRDQDFEIVLVLQPVTSELVDALGWPIGFFEDTYGSLADDPLVEVMPVLPEPTRDEIE
jgi:hypothetical protein